MIKFKDCKIIKKVLAGALSCIILIAMIGRKDTFASELEWYNYYLSSSNQYKQAVCNVPYSYGRTCTFQLNSLSGTAVGKLVLITPYDNTQWANTDGSGLVSITLNSVGQTKSIRMTGHSANMTGYARFLCSLQFNSGSGTASSSGTITY